MKDALLLYRYGFLFCLALALLYLWLPTYFLTGDGPSHVHNAGILFDLLLGRNTKLYAEYYQINGVFNPNWLSHLLLGVFLTTFSAPVSEKLLLTGYVLLMIFGFRNFLKELAPGKEWLSVLVFLLLFNHPLQMGFFNSGLSVALMWWLLVYLLRWLKERRVTHVMIAMLLSLLVWTAHMSGYMYALLATGCFFLGSIWSSESWKIRTRLLAGVMVVHLLPMVLTFLYIGRNNDLHVDTSDFIPRLGKLLYLPTLVTLHHTEIYPARVVGVFLVIWLITAFGRMVFSGTLNDDSLAFRKSYALLLIGVLLIYFFLPDWMASGGLFNIRTQYITAMFFLAALALSHWTALQKKVIFLGAILLFIWLTAVRLPVIWRASAAVEEYLSLQQYIKPGSTVLPLSFHHNGCQPNGRWVADRIWLFMHAADYLAVSDPLIILSNYEANAGFFPLQWHYEKNPFAHLAIGPGIEGLPPSVDIRAYQQKTGVDIDYVLLWCEGLEENRSLISPLKEDLAKDYERIAVSDGGFAQLYKRK